MVQMKWAAVGMTGILLLTAGCVAPFSSTETPNQQPPDGGTTTASADMPATPERGSNVYEYLNRPLPSGPIELHVDNTHSERHSVTVELAGQNGNELYEFDAGPGSSQTVPHAITRPYGTTREYTVSVAIDERAVSSEEITVSRGILEVHVEIADEQTVAVTTLVN